jgi:signal transduction histidine kinase
LPELLPRVTRWLAWISCVVAVAGACLVLCGKYGGRACRANDGAAIDRVLYRPGQWLSLRGHRPAHAFLFIFGIFTRCHDQFPAQYGVLPNFWTNHAATLGAFVHMMLMSLRLNRRYAELRRAKDRAQAEAVRAVRPSMNGWKSRWLRTTALQQEIGRRAALEGELRTALAVETRTREEQLDFVAMVSHEFHTLGHHQYDGPANRPQSGCRGEKTLQRCQNLREASGRMTALVDEYRSADRMETSAATFRPQPCDLRAPVGGRAGQWPEGRIEASVQALPDNTWPTPACCA